MPEDLKNKSIISNKFMWSLVIENQLQVIWTKSESSFKSFKASQRVKQVQVMSQVSQNKFKSRSSLQIKSPVIWIKSLTAVFSNKSSIESFETSQIFSQN